MSAQHDYLMKVVLIGDSSVGKSNLALRYAGQPFTLQSKPTIGVEFFSKNLEIDNKIIKAQVWDTAGQQRFRAITNAYYKGAHAAIIVYDVTRAATFQNVQKWLKQLKQNTSHEGLPIMLIGNKIDLVDKMMVKSEEGKKYAQQNSLVFAETSAKDQKTVHEALDSFIKYIYQKCKQKNILVDAKKPKLTNQTISDSKKKQKTDDNNFSLGKISKRIKALDKERCCV